MYKFSERLKEMRERRGIPRYVLAQRIGLSDSMISRYESGEQVPTIEPLKKLAEIFDCSVDYLLGETDYSGRYPK